MYFLTESRTSFSREIKSISYHLLHRVLNKLLKKKKKFTSVTCNGSKFQVGTLEIFNIINENEVISI